MTKDQLDALEHWIVAIIRDQNSDHIQDTIYKNNWYEQVLLEFGFKDREDD